MKTATHSKSRHVGSDPVKHIIQNLLTASRKGKQERLRKDSHKAPDKEESGKKGLKKKGKEKSKLYNQCMAITSWTTSTHKNQ